MNVNIDKDKVIKVLGWVCTLAGTGLGIYSSNKDNAKNIQKEVAKHLQNNK